MIGSGSHGTVYEHSDPDKVTKRLELYRTSKKYGDYLAGEALVEPIALTRLHTCKVPYIVKLHDIQVDRNGANMCVTMEKLQKVTMDYTDDEVRKLIGQLFISVTNMHIAGVYHADIKIDNLMISPDSGDIRIIDFGLAIIDKNRLMENSKFLYTRAYRSPEIMLRQPTIDLCKTDTWAAGVCAAELMLNRCYILGMGFSKTEILTNIVGRIGIPKGGELPMMPGWPDFYRELNIKDIEETTIIEEICNKRGVAAADFIRKVLSPGPSNRPTAEEMLSHIYLSDTLEIERITPPKCVWLQKSRNTGIANLYYNDYDYDSLVYATTLLELLNLPINQKKWFLAAMEIVSTYRFTNLTPLMCNKSSSLDVLYILERPETIQFLSQYHITNY